MRIHRLLAPAAAAVALAIAPAAAHAAAPGWSTPHTASGFTVGTYAAGANGQAAELFANGGAGQRTAQLRAIKTNATQGTVVGVNSGGPGFNLNGLSVNDDGALVAAWSMDLLNGAPVSVAAALGSRTSLPRTATVVVPTGQLVSALATGIAGDGTGIVAWIQSPIGATTASTTTVQVATLRSGQAPVVTTVATRAGALLSDLDVGFDASGRPVISWSVTVDQNSGPGIVGLARGTGPGTFAPAVETIVDPTQPLLDLQTFVTGDGGLLLFWLNGAVGSTPVSVRYSQATSAGLFTTARTLISGSTRGRPAFAANGNGRAAVLFPLASGSGTTLRALLRTSSGTWGSARLLGPSGARNIVDADIGVDARGRVVALWDDAGASAPTPTRILAARSSSSTNPLNTYNQVTQRSGDRRCDAPTLALSSSGDGLGSWLCSTSSSGSIGSPRLARLTAPS